MTITNFLVEFESCFQSIPSGLINSGTKFRELEYWDSLVALSVLAMIDTEYGIVLKADDLRMCNTPQAIFDLIQVNIKK
jgi:acyl carrier protein